MTTDQRHHTIDYVEINTDDLAASTAFYAAAFGWEFNDYGGEYAGIKDPRGEGEVGGINPGQPGGPGGPLVQLYSEDLAATESAVVAAGGTIVVPAFDFPGGRRFHFTDPAGNVLGVWTQA